MLMDIEPETPAGKNHDNKSCTWYFSINNEHIFEIYRDKNFTLGKSYTDSSFMAENNQILGSLKKIIKISPEILGKNTFILKAICKSSGEEILNKRKDEIESEPENVGKYTFILL